MTYQFNPQLIPNIPNELTQFTQWVVWRYEARDNGKFSKVPYSPKTGKQAKSNNPDTWVKFNDTFNCLGTGKYNGIGFMFSANDGIIGIDIDHCIVDGQFTKEALEIIEKFKPSYTEISPSGQGIRIFCKGSFQRFGKNTGSNKWLEVYNHTSPRYLTVTGNILEGSGKAIVDCQESLDWFYETYFKPVEPATKSTKNPPANVQTAVKPALNTDLSTPNKELATIPFLADDDVLNIIKRSKQASKFEQLWAGGGNEDLSSGDLALCSMLAFYTHSPSGGGYEQLNRLFMRSNRIRDKWHEKHGSTSYGDMTINKAVAGLTDFYKPSKKLNKQQFVSTENPPAPVLKKRKHVFWFVNKKDELKINIVDFLDFLEKSGFSRIYLNRLESTLVQIFSNSLIEEASAEKIRDFTLSYVESLDGVITENGHNYRDLKSLLVGANNVYFGDGTLKSLKLIKKQIVTDSKTSSYVFYRNAVVVITKDSIDTIPYSQLNGIIWKDSVLDRDIELLPKSELRNGMFARFQYNVCSPADVRKNPTTNEQKQLINKRFSVLKSTMGYLMHRFCNPNQLKATVWCDEKVSDYGNEGRSGKGLSMLGVRKLRNVTVIDGKSFDSGNRFKFQHATPSTEVIFFDDIDKNFKIEMFYSVLSEISLGSLTIERKNSPLIPLKQAIKVAMTTNHTIRGDSASDRARKHEIELSYYYDDKFTPAVEFGCMFFSEWDKSEWLLFDNYMLHCLQFYLEHGLIEPVVINLKLRKLLDETAHEFVEFADDIPRNERFDKSVVYNNFIEEYPDFNRGYKAIKQRTFTNWLKMYCDYKGLKLSESRSNTTCYFTFTVCEFDKQITPTSDFIVNDSSQADDIINIISNEYQNWCKNEINKLPYPKSTHIAVCECLTRFKRESKNYNIDEYLADLITALQSDVEIGNDTTHLIQLIYDYGIYATNETPIAIQF